MTRHESDVSCNYAPAVFYPGCALENLRQNSILYLNPASWAVRGPNSPCFLPCSKPSSARDPSLEPVSSLSARVVTKFEITQQQTPCWPYHQAKVEQHQKQVSVHAELDQSNFDRYHIVSRLCLTTMSHTRGSPQATKSFDLRIVRCKTKADPYCRRRQTLAGPLAPSSRYCRLSPRWQCAALTVLASLAFSHQLFRSKFPTLPFSSVSLALLLLVVFFLQLPA